MLFLNLSHPLPPDPLARVEALTGPPVEGALALLAPNAGASIDAA